MNTNDNPYAAPDTLETAAPGQGWLQTDSAGLSRTVIGLHMVYYGIVIVLLSMISLVVILVVPLFMFISAIGWLTGYVMMLVGPLFCLAVPSETGAKGWIVGAVGFQLTGFLLAIMQRMLPGPWRATLNSVGGLAALIGCIFFVMFMRKLASFIGRNDLSGKALNVLGLGFVLFVTTIFVSVIGRFSQQLSILLLIPAILFLVVFVMYANLIGALRLALKSGPSAASSPVVSQ